MRDYFLEMWRYTRWANQQMAAALATTEHPEALRLLCHVLGAQDVWLGRLVPGLEGAWAVREERSADECAARNQASCAAWIEFLQHEADGLARVQEYKNLAGEPFSNTVREIVAHVINHGAHHRAQIAYMLRVAGAVPPPTDYIIYLRRA